MAYSDYVLGNPVIAKTTQGDTVASGVIVGYSDVPMVCIRDQWTGENIWWRLDLCKLFGFDNKDIPKKTYGPF